MNVERARPSYSAVAIAKKLLPESMVHEIQRYRAFARNERPLYLRIRISNQLGLSNPRLSRIPETARSILFVCFGNIMRSPMCEALFKRDLSRFRNTQFTVVSAGLNATPGRPAHDWAITAAKDFGISLENHRAQVLTPEMVKRADAILVMDYHNQVQILSRWADAKEKTFLLSAYAGEDYRSVEISDPYYTGLEGTRTCYSILSACTQNLARALLNHQQA